MPDNDSAETPVAEVQRLFVQNTPALRGFVLSLMADFSLVDDVVQETFLTAVQKADAFQPGTNFVAWACAIARFKVLEAGRRGAALPLSPEVIESLCAGQPEAETSWRLPLLTQCLEELSPQMRRIVDFRYQQAHKPAAIARLVGWTPEAIYVASERAHQFEGGDAPSGTGASGRSYRRPVGDGGGSGTLTFMLGCDPARQNYVTIKLWGNDDPEYITVAGNPIEEGFGPPVYPNRFYYYTVRVPIASTTNQTSVPITVSYTALAQGEAGKAIYAAFTHTAPQFVPDANEVVGSAPPRSGQVTNFTALTAEEVITLLHTNRLRIFAASEYHDDIIRRQVLPGTPGAPPEVIRLDLFSRVLDWTNANPDATNGQRFFRLQSP